VIEGSPAATAGIKAGDVIIEVDANCEEVTQLQRSFPDLSGPDGEDESSLMRIRKIGPPP